MSVQPVQPPGLLTLVTHSLVIAVLLVVLVIIWPLRAVTAPVAEALIRLSDSLTDTLQERLNR